MLSEARERASRLPTTSALERSKNDEFRRVYGKPGGGAWQAGDRIVLEDLGRTLARIRTRNNGKTRACTLGNTTRMCTPVSHVAKEVSL